MKVLLALPVTLLVLFVVLPDIKVSASTRKLVCYLETWAENRASPMDYDIKRLPENSCDYLVVMYVTLDAVTWGIKMHNGYNELDSDELSNAVASKKQNPNMKVLLAIGGWEDGVAKYSDMMSEKNRRDAFIRSVVSNLEELGFDGLELHWLYPGSVWRGGRDGDKANLVHLVKELTVAFKPKNWIVTANVPPDEASIDKGFNVERLNSLLHQMHVHTYDLRGDWTNSADNHSPLYRKAFESKKLKNLNINSTMDLWVRKGASRRKLLPTFPLFGRSFTLRDKHENNPGAAISGPGKPGEFTNAAGLMAYYEICDRLQQDKLERHFDSTTQTPYAVSGDQWVGYDDEESLQKKAKFIKDREYGGAALFAVSMDDFTGQCGQSHFLVKKMKEFLSSGGD